jgi:hypothetical protein
MINMLNTSGRLNTHIKDLNIINFHLNLEFFEFCVLLCLHAITYESLKVIKTISSLLLFHIVLLYNVGSDHEENTSSDY